MAEVSHYFAAAEEERYFSNGGPCCRLLTARLRTWLDGAPECLPVASATAGLLVALRAAFGSAGPDRRYVATPSFTFTATAGAIQWAGFVPLFVDIDPETWQLDATALDTALHAHRGAVAGVMATSTFGTVASPEARAAWRATCAAHGVPLVVDSAAAFGSHDGRGGHAGGLGDTEVFSFHATKPFAIGEGGLVTTAAPAVAERAAALMNFGLDPARRLTLEAGINAKLSELHCAVALAVLGRFDETLARRRAAAAKVRAVLAGRPVTWQGGVEGSTFQFVPALLPDRATRDAAIEAAGVLGVEVRTMFDPPLHRHPAFAEAARGDLAVTEAIAARSLSLPCANMLEDWKVERIAAVFDLVCS